MVLGRLRVTTMDICLLGTGAADGIPALFDAGEVSARARRSGGKDVRSRSSALVDGHLKLDFPPDIWTQAQRFALEPFAWTGLVFTHSHDDHFARNELQYALFPFTEELAMPWPIYANQVVIDRIHDRYPDWPLELHLTQSFHAFRHLDYTITPVRANHKLDEDAQNLLIQHGGTTLFYGTDTGVPLPETMEFLHDYRLDALVLECTEGFHRTTYYGHLDLAGCIDVVNDLRERGILKADAPVATTHHAASGGATHAVLEEHLTPHRIQAGYDGLTMTF